MEHIFTSRLKLRKFEERDKEAFALLNQDPRVMNCMPKILSKEESDSFVDKIIDSYTQYGFGLLAAQLKATEIFIGYIGLAVPRFPASFTPCVEIGWRLAFEQWSHGYATEGAKAILKYAFTELILNEVVSFTVPSNIRSIKVMQRIGMKFIEEFEHPLLPEGHPLKKHLLYKINKNDWENLIL